MAAEMKTLVCPGPPEHEFEIPKGRGRPPRFCEEHKPNGKSEESKVSEETRQAPRKRPGSKDEEDKPRQGPPRRAPRIPASPEKGKLDEPEPSTDKTGTATMTDEGIRKLPRPGTADTKSRAKAEAAADRATAQHPDTDQSWPRGIQGRPMAKIEFSASELIPTGQYANVAVGPARITAFVDLDRGVEDGESYFSSQEQSNLVKATNELAEMVERDVVAVQRNLVLESIQDQLSQNGNS